MRSMGDRIKNMFWQKSISTSEEGSLIDESTVQ